MGKQPKDPEGTGEKPETKAGDLGDYEVGYCRPPKHTRFQKNQPSANPNGAPRKKPKSVWKAPALNPAYATVLKAAAEVVKVNGEDVPIIDAAFKKLTQLGLAQNNPRALIRLIEMTTAAQQGAHDEKLELLEYALKYRAKWLPRFQACEEAGKPVPNVLPHPEDVVIHEDGTVAVVGAVDEEGKALQDERQAALRKLVKAIHTARDRVGVYPPDKQFDARMRALERDAIEINKLLPPRLRTMLPLERKAALASGKYPPGKIPPPRPRSRRKSSRPQA